MLNDPNTSTSILEPVTEFTFYQVCLEPASLLNITFLLVILKDFSKLWVNSPKHSYIRTDLSQLFKPLAKALMNDSSFFSKNSVYWFSPLSEEDPWNPITCDIKFFVTIIYGCIKLDLDVRCGRPHKSASPYFISMFCSCLLFWVNHLSTKRKEKKSK